MNREYRRKYLFDVAKEKITYKNKLFGRDLTDRDIKFLLEGKSLKTKNGDTVTLDVDSDNFLHFEWKERKEDKDF